MPARQSNPDLKCILAGYEKWVEAEISALRRDVVRLEYMATHHKESPSMGEHLMKLLVRHGVPLAVGIVSFLISWRATGHFPDPMDVYKRVTGAP